MKHTIMQFCEVLAIAAVMVAAYWWICRRGRPASHRSAYVQTETSHPIDERHPQPTFAELSAADEAQLDAQRSVVLSAARERYGATALRKDSSDLALLQRMLSDQLFSAAQTYELQCLGVVFGDVLASRLGLHWMLITDEYGTDPTLVVPGTTANLNALTAISKRVERGESVDVNALCRVFDEEIARMRQAATR